MACVVGRCCLLALLAAMMSCWTTLASPLAHTEAFGKYFLCFYYSSFSLSFSKVFYGHCFTVFLLRPSHMCHDIVFPLLIGRCVFSNKRRGHFWTGVCWGTLCVLTNTLNNVFFSLEMNCVNIWFEVAADFAGVCLPGWHIRHSLLFEWIDCFSSKTIADELSSQWRHSNSYGLAVNIISLTE